MKKHNMLAHALTIRRCMSRHCLFSVLTLLFILPCRLVLAQKPYDTKLLNGSDWLNGSGVDVYSNGSATNVSNDYSLPAFGMKWQCVELCQRLYRDQGWWSKYFPVKVAYQIYDVASSMKMQSHANGDGYIPVPGDMVVFSGGPKVDNIPVGHVSIVDHVDSKSVYLVEQNWDNQNARAILGRSGKNGSKLSDRGSKSNKYTVRGVVHSPNNPFTNTASTDIYVDIMASGLEDGSQLHPYHSIRQAIDNASTSQAVHLYVRGGWYKETIVIHQNIRILNNGGGSVHIGN